MLYKITITTDKEYDLCKVTSKGDAEFILGAYLAKLNDLKGSLPSLSNVSYRLYYRNRCIYNSKDQIMSKDLRKDFEKTNPNGTDKDYILWLENIIISLDAIVNITGSCSLYRVEDDGE